MPHPLTPRQHAIVEFIAEYVREHGYAPSLQEIGDEFTLKAPAVHGHLERLQAKGWLTRTRHVRRSIQLLIHGQNCPTCGQVVTPKTADSNGAGA